MPDHRIAGVDGAGCIRRLEFLPMADGVGVLLRITGAGERAPLALELDLTSVTDLRIEAGIATSYALQLRREQDDRVAAIRHAA
jgi:hypothetical protein